MHQKSTSSTPGFFKYLAFAVIAGLLGLGIYRTFRPDPKTRLIDTSTGLVTQSTQVARAILDTNAELAAIGALVKPYSTGEQSGSFTRRDALLEAIAGLNSKSAVVEEELLKLQEKSLAFGAAADAYVADKSQHAIRRSQVALQKSKVLQNIESIRQLNERRKQLIQMLQLLGTVLDQAMAVQLYASLGDMQNMNKQLAASMSEEVRLN